MSTDWKDKLLEVAPAIVSAFATPAAGAAVAVLGKALLGKEDATEQEIEKAIQSATPADLARLKEIDNDFKLTMAKFGYDTEKLRSDAEYAANALQIEDTKNAREAFAKSENVFRLAVCILATYAVCVSGVLGGVFYLLMHPAVEFNAGMVAVVFSLIGTVVGNLQVNAQQVISWCFGTTIGSDKKTNAVTQALQTVKDSLSTSTR